VTYGIYCKILKM